MRRVVIKTAEPTTIGMVTERHGLSESLGPTDVAINRYHLAAGASLQGIHRRMDQEEVFAMLKRMITVETVDGEITAHEGEAIRVDSGEYQSGRNDADRNGVLLALSTPRETTDMWVPLECPVCGHESLHWTSRIGSSSTAQTPV